MTKSSPTYPTDLKYSEWLLIAEFFPTYRRGRPCTWTRRVIANAIWYVTRTGCQWRMLPKEYPPWQTVYGYFRRWTRSGLWARVNAVLVARIRTRQGRAAQPSAAIIDSQSIKTSAVRGPEKGYDAGKSANRFAEISICC